MGTGKAFIGITHEVVNPNTRLVPLDHSAPAGRRRESVQLYLKGVLAGTFVADADGNVAIGINTGAGFGYITIEEIGLTSGKDTGGVVQVAPRPVFAGRHGSASRHQHHRLGSLLPLSAWLSAQHAATVPLYRNGVFLGTFRRTPPEGFL